MGSIHEFSELGPYFDQPVRTYSSGMYMRLGFSLAVAEEPDVLIVDEALSVGDVYFQQKCIRKIRDFRKKGATILFVSHDASLLSALCDRVMVLSRGKQIYCGGTAIGLEVYNAEIAAFNKPAGDYFVEHGRAEQGTTSGDGSVELKSIRLLQSGGAR